MTEDQFSLLLADTKNYLDITWEDEATDKKLSGILRRGMNYLDDKAGASLNYLEEGNTRALLFDYVRYARANALDEFEDNYLHDLLALNLKHRVKEMEESAEPETAG